MAEAGPLAPARGRLLRLAYPAPPGAIRGTAVSWAVPVLAVLLLMFWQCFQYMIDVPPLYWLSKVWPLLTLPAALWALFVLRLPYATYYVVLLAYVIGVSPALSMVQLSNSFTEAAITSTKVWSFLFYFALSAVLAWLRPSLGQIRRAVLVLAAATGGVMVLLWLTVPLAAYKTDPTLSQVFLYDDERGYRIVLPMGLAMIGLFYVARRLSQSPRLWHVAVIAGSFAAMLIIYKQRLAILSALLVTGFAATSRLRTRMPLLFYALLLAGAAAALTASMFLPGQLLSRSLGSSLSIRQTSADLAWTFISDDPLRLLFGVGATTAYSALTLGQILHFPSFFAADIGWLGVLLEYGLIGAGLIGGAYLLASAATWRAGRGGDAFLEALFDWTLYQALVTSVYSVVYTPGEIASAMALAIYALRQQAGSAVTGRIRRVPPSPGPA